MSKGSVNKVILVGNLGADPEIRYMPSGEAVANLSIATSDSWKEKQSGEMQERTEWHRIVLFRRLAEIAGEYLRKGSKVFVEGSIRTRKWQDKNSQDRYTTEIWGTALQMLDGSNRGNTQNNSNASMPNFGANTTTEHDDFMSGPAAMPKQPVATEAASAHADFEDDMPF